VSIAVPEVSPLIEPLDGPVKKQFSAGLARRLSGRPPSFHAAESSQLSMEELPAAALDDASQENHKSKHKHHHHHSKSHDKLLTQVAEWLQAEKAKRAAKKAQRQGLLGSIPPTPDEDGMAIRPDSRDSSQGDLSLEKLQRILEDNMTNEFGPSPSASSSVVGSRRGSVQRRPSKKLTRTASSDTEYHDGDVIVPTCDVVLDNSKTLSYGASGTLTPGSEPDLAKLTKKAERERKAWSTFKTEILKLAHTLRLKGWRRIPLENGDDIEVERLSGALTNAVYVVFPPKTIPVPAHDAHAPPVSRRPPAKLLLRIYGPQVEHLIDRENELSILRRLARKKIGPRLLGTFLNGRFEEYFESTTLTARDLRVAETSKQIAKRMRELHDGIELLPSEREEGPFVWKNWDKWVERCEYVISFLDKQVLSGKVGPKAKARGLVCGVEWPVFREVVERYRRLVVEHYGGVEGERKMLVFAHNDVSFYIH
jgi:choline kinase